MILKLEEGKYEITIKEFCSRKTRKLINNALYSEANVNIEGEDGKTKQSVGGLSMNSMEKANDVALVEMVDKILIDGKETEVNIKTFDEMPAEIADEVISAIDDLTKKKSPND